MRVCVDCGGEFAFTAGEERFFADKGFEAPPARCARCRAARKRLARRRFALPGEPSERARAGSLGEQARLAARPSGADAPLSFVAACAFCGDEARVPFRPAGGRPVFCKECYSFRESCGSGLDGR